MRLTPFIVSELDYPTDVKYVRITFDKLVWHPISVQSTVTALIRNRAPVTRYEEEWVGINHTYSHMWRDFWFVYYSVPLRMVVYSIPYFPFAGYLKYMNPENWTKKPYGFIEGKEKMWTNGDFILAAPKFASKDKSPTVPLTEQIQDILSVKKGRFEHMEHMFIVDNPDVYAKCPLLMILTSARVAFYELRNVDAANDALYYHVPDLHILDEEDYNQWYLVYRLRKRREHPIVFASRPVKVSNDALDIIEEMQGIRNCPMMVL